MGTKRTRRGEKKPAEKVLSDASLSYPPTIVKEEANVPKREPSPTVRPLDSIQALQYKFALLQEELIGEKKNIVMLKRVVARKDEEILVLRRETADLKEIVVTREEQDLFRENRILLQRLGVGEDEEVLIEGGRMFVAPKGTARKRNKNG